MGEMLRRRISQEVNEATMYLIIADNLGKVEQISVVVRYVNNCNIYERFLTYIHAETLNGQALSQHILGALHRKNSPIIRVHTEPVYIEKRSPFSPY